jgi:hypothetical protein
MEGFWLFAVSSQLLMPRLSRTSKLCHAEREAKPLLFAESRVSWWFSRLARAAFRKAISLMDRLRVKMAKRM